MPRAIDHALKRETKKYVGSSRTGLAAAWGSAISSFPTWLWALPRGSSPRYLSLRKPDPGVVVVDEAGRFAIPLVGGHVGGANELSRTIAEALGGTAVVSTATDSLGVPALDQLGLGLRG